MVTGKTRIHFELIRLKYDQYIKENIVIFAESANIQYFISAYHNYCEQKILLSVITFLALHILTLISANAFFLKCILRSSIILLGYDPYSVIMLVHKFYFS